MSGNRHIRNPGSSPSRDPFPRLPRPARRLVLAAMMLAAIARTVAGALLCASGPVRRMAFEAVMLLALARLLVGYVPMRRWRRHLNTGPPRGGSDPEGERALGREVGRIVRKVASCMPFRAVCLPQAMAAQWMLRRRGVSSRLIFGVRRASEEPGGPLQRKHGAAAPGRTPWTGAGLDFHAWLTVAGENVVGDQGTETYVPLPEVTPWPDGGAPATGARATRRR